MSNTIRTGRLPVAIFRDVRTVLPTSTHWLDWSSFASLLAEAAATVRPDKESAPLIASAYFGEGGSRRKANVKAAGAVFLDIDGGANFNAVRVEFERLGIAAAMYTTASNRDDDRFRAVIPLAEHVSASDYTTTFRSLGIMFDAINPQRGGSSTPGGLDSSKRGAESLFYLPGRYTNASNQFVLLEGSILHASDWWAICPPPSPSPSPPPSRPVATSAKRAIERSEVRSSYSLFGSQCVKASWIDAYLQCGGGWHLGLYKFMARVAMSALRRNMAISSSDLAGLAHDLDDLDGGWYCDRRTRDIEAEAMRALDWAHAKLKGEAPGSNERAVGG